MRQFALLLALALVLNACDEKKEISSISPENWARRTIEINPDANHAVGRSYLSVYSQIYSQTEHRTHDLTATISMRNTSMEDTIYLLSAKYFDTHGLPIRTYFNKPIYLKPMETVEIVIDELDKEGGTGANFIFDWAIPQNSSEPLFEGVMISTSGQQGLSFSTQGKRIK
jgi:Protein of unknown function (DUF3124)